ncbi:hypothetical protein TCAL_15638 [Tigriopus californicus]|uniref:Uncharacterized protein n=1 Tax=Tigriopus californicus TaxID=6832 RepID=A0A553PAK3_TIGCA|nr:hypothetical protein TCAL_15638 [Tigriopus californicus]
MSFNLTSEMVVFGFIIVILILFCVCFCYDSSRRPNIQNQQPLLRPVNLHQPGSLVFPEHYYSGVQGLPIRQHSSNPNWPNYLSQPTNTLLSTEQQQPEQTPQWASTASTNEESAPPSYEEYLSSQVKRYN